MGLFSQGAGSMGLKKQGSRERGSRKKQKNSESIERERAKNILGSREPRGYF